MYTFDNKNVEFFINKYLNHIQERNINGVNDDLLEYIDDIVHEKIPLKMPDINHDLRSCSADRDMSQLLFKKICQALGVYANVSQEICKNMASYIKDRKVLEVMAGRGWLAKGLREQGVDIITSDDFSWEKSGKIGLGTVTDVLDINGVDAIKEYKKDSSLLLIAWPYMDNNGYQMIKSWGKSKNVIYIGEGNGGCTADSEFFDNIKFNKKVIKGYQSHVGLHDKIYIGKYTPKPKLKNDL